MEALINLFEQTQMAVALGGLIILLLIEQAHPFFDAFKGSWKEKGRHLFANFSLALVNVLVTSFIFAVAWLWAADWANTNDFGLLNWLDAPLIIHAAGAVLLMDIWMYFWHRMNHELPFLWRFHRVHHADAEMDVTTAGRFHTGEIIFSSILRIPVILLIGMHFWELLLYETLLVAVVQFHHADIALPEKVEKALRWFIVTPGMHKVHHSRWQPETDSNYSSLFSFWDRIWRTFRLRDPLKSLRLGLDEFDSDEDREVKGLFTMPFREGKGGGGIRNSKSSNSKRENN